VFVDLRGTVAGLKNMLGSQQTLFSLVSFESFAPHFSVQKKKRKKSVWLYRKDPKFDIFLASVPFLHI
jgi:hypothetical protein